MSLAQSIINGRDISPKPPKRKLNYVGGVPKVTGPKYASSVQHGRVMLWRAHPTQDGKTLNLGEFQTKERAEICVRLFLFWRKRGMGAPPTKLKQRMYIRRS